MALCHQSYLPLFTLLFTLSSASPARFLSVLFLSVVHMPLSQNFFTHWSFFLECFSLLWIYDKFFSPYSLLCSNVTLLKRSFWLYLKKKNQSPIWSSHCFSMGMKLLHSSRDVGLIPSPAQWVKDLVLPQHRSKLWLRFKPWPGNSISHEAAKKKKKKKKKKKQPFFSFPYYFFSFFFFAFCTTWHCVCVSACVRACVCVVFIYSWPSPARMYV